MVISGSRDVFEREISGSRDVFEREMFSSREQSCIGKLVYRR